MFCEFIHEKYIELTNKIRSFYCRSFHNRIFAMELFNMEIYDQIYTDSFIVVKIFSALDFAIRMFP